MIQEDPPKFRVPKFLTAPFIAIRAWMIGNRVVEGYGISISDAAGGGKMISTGQGLSANIVVCVDNGDETYTQMTAQFSNGILTGLVPSEE